VRTGDRSTRTGPDEAVGEAHPSWIRAERSHRPMTRRRPFVTGSRVRQAARGDLQWLNPSSPAASTRAARSTATGILSRRRSRMRLRRSLGIAACGRLRLGDLPGGGPRARSLLHVTGRQRRARGPVVDPVAHTLADFSGRARIPVSARRRGTRLHNVGTSAERVAGCPVPSESNGLETYVANARVSRARGRPAARSARR
jgi:hypothetical protein